MFLTILMAHAHAIEIQEYPLCDMFLGKIKNDKMEEKKTSWNNISKSA